jgi:hypothetical protein
MVTKLWEQQKRRSRHKAFAGAFHSRVSTSSSLDRRPCDVALAEVVLLP